VFRFMFIIFFKEFLNFGNGKSYTTWYIYNIHAANGSVFLSFGFFRSKVSRGFLCISIYGCIYAII
jgi:hypothetical protein